MLFISPPFGNYFSPSGTTPIRGSFTLEPRPGLLMQILRTLRLTPDGWVNKIGLRNKGLAWALETYGPSEILSIAILKKEEIPRILKMLPENQNIEINVSCPNTDDAMVSDGIDKFVNPKRRWCILKLAPKTSHGQVDAFYRAGFRQFHCCNTLPTPNGGLSGRAIMPYTASLVKYLSNKYGNKVEIIAGGGVRRKGDVAYYESIGANHVSVSSIFFSPLLSMVFFWD